jgi:hypothetical protein
MPDPFVTFSELKADLHNQSFWGADLSAWPDLPEIIAGIFLRLGPRGYRPL